MLTSPANQYLRPEYLSPIQGNTIELDAKKSPLALLAATCSQIGSDALQKGHSIGQGDSSTKSSSKDPKASPGAKSPCSALSGEDSSTTNNNTTGVSISKIASFRPYEKKKEDQHHHNSGDDERASPYRTTPTTRSSPSQCSPGDGGGSGRHPNTASHNGRVTPHSHHHRSSSRNSDTGRPSSSSSSSLASRSMHDPVPATSTSSSSSNSSLRTTSSPSSAAAKLSSLSGSLSLGALTGLSELCKDPLAAYKLSPSLYPALGLGFDPLGAAGLAALTAKVSTASTTSCSSFTTALSSPYVGWTRVKTSSGSETIVPVCRDPYCAGCQINAHAAQVVNGSCPPACPQCGQITAYTKNLSASLPSVLHSLPHSTLSSLYAPHSLLGGSVVTQQNVCNWITGDNYCGKRFSSSEDLLQHLRNHTSSAAADSSAATLASLHHALHPAHPLLTGHLPRGYPTPPLSPLSASARYHPYAAKPSLTHVPPSAHLPPASALSVASLSALAPHPLSAYYSPYSIYARSLGATAGLHP